MGEVEGRTDGVGIKSGGGGENDEASNENEY